MPGTTTGPLFSCYGSPDHSQAIGHDPGRSTFPGVERPSGGRAGRAVVDLAHLDKGTETHEATIAALIKYLTDQQMEVRGHATMLGSDRSSTMPTSCDSHGRTGETADGLKVDLVSRVQRDPSYVGPGLRTVLKLQSRFTQIQRSRDCPSLFGMTTDQVTTPAPLASSTCRQCSQSKASVMQSARQSAAS
ncbi:hypothetical protein G9272_05705 [Streptomyces asoensis]|uniref:Uncharacterized protein n=1 Tax=Streptomyces asoensis TaxID=249586 RepID=A0A6M4WPN5_9ACTN|nr:hypothetical protein G9272_05705 [Streptomyces asoensis]